MTPYYNKDKGSGEILNVYSRKTAAAPASAAAAGLQTMTQKERDRKRSAHCRRRGLTRVIKMLKLYNLFLQHVSARLHEWAVYAN
jgi:hypothetical protein